MSKVDKPKPRIGLICTVNESYASRGMDFPNALKPDEALIIDRLKQVGVEVITPGIILNVAQAHEAVRLFKESDIDGLIISHLCYTSDLIVMTLLNGLPEVPYCIYLQQGVIGIPYDYDVTQYYRGWQVNSIVQITATLKRLYPHRPFQFVIGHTQWDKTIHKLESFCQAAAVIRSIRGEKLIAIPGPHHGMYDTWPNDVELMRLFQVHIDYISKHEIELRAQKVGEAELQERISEIYARCKFDEDSGITSEEMESNTRMGMGLENFVAEHGAAVVGVGGTKYNYTFSLLADKGTVVAEENDLAAGLGLLILQRLTGNVPLYFEHLSYDIERNLILGGHNSYGAFSLAKEQIHLTNSKYGYMDKNGRWIAPDIALEFDMKPGEVTILGLGIQSGGEYVIRLAKGTVIDEPTKKLHMPYALIHLENIDVETYFKKLAVTGGGHHFGVVHGDVTEAVNVLAEILNIPVTVC